MELIMSEILTLETLYFMNLYKKSNVKPYSFLVIDTILASDNLLRIGIGKAGSQFLRLNIHCRHIIRKQIRSQKLTSNLIQTKYLPPCQISSPRKLLHRDFHHNHLVLPRYITRINLARRHRVLTRVIQNRMYFFLLNNVLFS